MSSTTHNAPRGKFAVGLLAVFFAWMIAVIVAAEVGILAGLGRVFMPGFALLVAAGIAVPAAVYFIAPSARHAIQTVGLHRLTLLHIWRIPAAMLFFYYGLRAELPDLFWILAGVGDLLAGCFALTMLWRPRTASNYRRVHLFGFADFIVAVGTGLAFTLLQDPRMSLLTTLPMALVPLFGVGISGASHIVALSMLREESNSGC